MGGMTSSGSSDFPACWRMVVRMGLAALVLGGCGAGKTIVKRSRHSENAGAEIRGKVQDGVKAAEALLRADGYDVRVGTLYKGPGANGRTIEGMKEIRATGREVGTSVAMGLLGAETGGKKERFALVRVEMNQKWADDLESGVPDVFVLRMSAEDCMKSAAGTAKKGSITKADECFRYSGFDEGRFESLVRGKIEGAAAASARTAAAPAGSPQDEAEYQAATRDYGAGKYDDAWRKGHAIIQRTPGHWQSWQLIGNCQYAKGDKDGAMASYKQSLVLNPDNPQLKTWVGQLMMAK